jgi:spore coat protein A, manganese oxidase
MQPTYKTSAITVCFLLAALLCSAPPDTRAQALPGGTLDPTTITKYVTPLVIPPVMKTTGENNTYDIAVRQFKQQILPAGMPATTVWSYGPAADPLPAVAAPDPASQFNYPSYTIETSSAKPVSVRWRNELVADPIACAASATPAVDPACNFIPHLLTIDQTLHWANPPATGCMDGTNRVDCRTADPAPYVGPVPIVTHVHGAHVDPHSDGYPEAWWLPKASNIPAGYAVNGHLFDDANGQAQGLNLGFADYLYRNDQPATTLWYHDHALGMTRANVYAGPAGFWLIRGGANDLLKDLPGPAPVAGQGVLPLNTPGDPVRNSIREIPVVIQDRSFNSDGSLFYPDTRAFFDNFLGPYVPASDISPLWNPEAFFNTMVVNGTTWPVFEVAPALYRLRLLNGCNSRMLNLSLFEITDGAKGVEHPFYQIGAEQGFLPYVVAVQTGSSKIYDGTMGGRTVTAPDVSSALLMGNAERADVIVDFRGLPNGTIIRMINTGPDEPFGGFPVTPADPGTTGQVMQFVVNTTAASAGGPFGASPTDPVLANGTTPNPNAAIDPTALALPAEATLGAATGSRNVSLNELESGQVCVDPATNALIQVFPPNDPTFLTACTDLGGAPLGPLEAMVGIVDLAMPTMPMGMPLMWTDMMGMSTPLPVQLQNGLTATVPVTENPQIIGGVAPIEEWNIYNFTMDAHPIHLHLVRFQVINRQTMPGMMTTPFPQQPWETGFKDTVIAYPGEITTVRARFDIAGLYVWHCHIVEHEDNEMMRPYIVSASAVPNYSISGTVTEGGAGLAGVTVILSGAAGATATTNAMGMYWFTGLADGAYTVTPFLLGSTFTPASTPVTINGAAVTGTDFTAIAIAPCPATQALGAGNQKLENLRAFRDSNLTQSAVGRTIIQLYYNNAAGINAALDNSPALRDAARRMLEAVAPLLGK